jgi:hypothetical protein
MSWTLIYGEVDSITYKAYEFQILVSIGMLVFIQSITKSSRLKKS